MGTAILTARKAVSVITLGRLLAPAGGQWQARDSEQHAFHVPACACATARASGYRPCWVFHRASAHARDNLCKLAATLWWFTATAEPLKIEVFWGSPSPQGSHSPYILGDTTRPGQVTCVLVWSKSDRRRLRKTLHKQTNKQTLRK